jgi:hypothetical protein
MSDDCAYLEARIAKTEEMIAKVEDAILQLSSGAQSYELDTGQSRVRKTLADVDGLRLMLKELEDRRTRLKLLLCGGGVVRVIPGF